MAQTGGQTQKLPSAQRRAVRPRKVRRVKPPIGPPAPKPAGPAGPVARPKRVRRVAGPAGPVGRAETSTGPSRPAAGPSGPVGRQITDPKEVKRRGQQKQAVLAAKQGKPFNPEHLRGAIKAGLAPDVTERYGTFLVKKRRAVLPDYQAVVRPKTGAKYTGIPSNTETYVQHAAAPGSAGALKVLEKTAVPIHAIAGVASGHTPGYGVRHKTLFGSILKKAGAPGAVAGVGGFLGDVVFDPTTYLSGGTAPVARKVALRAAETASRQAAKQAAEAAAKEVARGGSEAAAKRASDAILREGENRARKAAERATAAAPQGKGVTIKFAGKHVPGVTRHTATVGRGAKKVASLAPQPVKNAATGARNLVSDVRPTLRTAGVGEEQFHGIRSAARQTRAHTNQQLELIDRHAEGLRKQIGPDNYAKVIDAIEKRKVHKLPDELKQPAVFLRSQFRHAQKIRRQAGLGEGTIRDYFPHAQHEPLVAGKGVDTTIPARQAKGSGRIVSYPGSSKQRTMRGPISEVNPKLAAEDRGQFSTDIPLVYANYQRETAKTVAAADLAKRLAKAGRAIKPGKAFELQPGERVYRLGFESAGSSSHVVGATKKGGDVVVKYDTGKGRFGLRPLSKDEELALANPQGRHSGQYVALHEQTVMDAAAQAAPTQSASAIGRTVDKTTRGFKRIATFTPGFHARNLVGDVQMGYLAQPGHKLPGNLAAAGKAIKGMHNQQRAAENLALSTNSTGTTIKVAGEDMPVDEFLKLAQQHGVTQSGAITRELVDLGGGATRGVGKAGRLKSGARRATRAVSQSAPVRALMQDRENIVRLATFKHGLDTGLDAERAASLSLNTHIDYGDLTHFERRYARRLMPFYTFSARALPLHVKTLVTNPGKFANIEKAREEIGGTDVSGYTPWQRRQFPVSVGDVGVTDSLPLTTLNEVPTSKNVGEYGSELYQFGMGLANPIIRDPVEYGANRSFTFRNDIQDPKNPLVSAPDWMGRLPASVRKELGVVQGRDKRSGKIVWKWPGKHDYALKAFALGPFNIANQLSTTGTNRVGQGTVEKAIAGATGVRIQPQDKVSVAINEKYDRLNTLSEKQAALTHQINPVNKQTISAKNPTPEYKRLHAQIRKLEREIYQLSKKRGDKVLPRAGAPPKGRRGGSLGGGFDGGFGGFGGAGFSD